MRMKFNNVKVNFNLVIMVRARVRVRARIRVPDSYCLGLRVVIGLG